MAFLYQRSSIIPIDEVRPGADLTLPPGVRGREIPAICATDHDARQSRSGEIVGPPSPSGAVAATPLGVYCRRLRDGTAPVRSMPFGPYRANGSPGECKCTTIDALVNQFGSA